MKKIGILAIFVCVFVIGLFLALPALKRHGIAVNCSNQMQAVLLETARIWPDDHDGHLPMDFRAMSNDFNPMLLICPADHIRQRATNWATFTMSNNCSYEILAPGILQSNTNTIFMRCKIHGFVGYTDGRLLDPSGKLLKPKRLW